MQRIEAVIGKKMEQWPADREEVALLRERVNEAGRLAVNEMKEAGGAGGRSKRRREGGSSGGKDERDRDDDVVEAGMPTQRKKGRR